MLDFRKFKVEIYTNKETPITDNTNLTYIKDETRDDLFVKIYYDKIEIGRGIILDFYKEFENIEENGNIVTKIKTFSSNGKTHESFTNYGQKIYKLKYLKSPPIKKEERKVFIKFFADEMNTYVKEIINKYKNIKLSYISSSSLIPDEIVNQIKELSSLEIADIIIKNSGQDSKSIETFKAGVENSSSKYTLNESLLSLSHQYIIIDDVMGNGSSIATILKKLYDKTNTLNFFLIVAKDVKR
jgi:hypothetical protein